MRIGRAVRVALVTATTACGGDVTPPADILKLEGIVRNGNTNLPVAGAVVLTGTYVDNAFVSRRISGTDAQGHYTIDDFCTGDDFLEAQAPGFATVVGPVACAPNRQTIDITLTPLFHP